MKPSLRLLRLHSCPIEQQLAMEEALFRLDHQNWCLLNDGTPPTIVMGLSQTPEELIHQEEAQRQKIPVLRRFSGGGTVLVDEHSLFFSLFMTSAFLPKELQHPSGILHKTHELLRPAFQPHDLLLKAEDFALFDKKIGGNAQAIRQGRFLNHTSFLWSWEKTRLQCLKHPAKEPSWRQQRAHEEFMGQLRSYFSSKEELLQKILEALSLSFTLEIASLDEVEHLRSLPHRKALCVLSTSGS